MHSEPADVVAVRVEILRLLRQQMEALNSPLGLTDEKLRECYERQGRVQELRDKLQAMLNSEQQNCRDAVRETELTSAAYSASAVTASAQDSV
jgi:lipopolysaccharide biosynthesis regulator YciM